MSTMMHSPFTIVAVIFLLLASTLLFSVDVLAVENTLTETVVTHPEKAKPLAGSELSTPGIAGNLAQTTLGLLFVLLVIAAAAWAFKRFGNVHVGAQGRMKIIGGISLGTRERAVLLQVGEQQLLVGVSPGRMQTLHVLDKPIVVDEKSDKSIRFSSRLHSAILDRKKDSNGGGK